MKVKYFLYVLIPVFVIALAVWYGASLSAQPEPEQIETGWQERKDSLTYILEDGTPASGWVTIEGIRYYFREDGTLATGWETVDGMDYYFLDNGTPATGWVTIDEVRYYFLENGTPATGWVSIDNASCYFNENGTPVTGWQDIDGNRYYLNANGAPLTGTQEIDGTVYVFDSDGTFYQGWVTIGEYEYYCLGDGSFATSPTEIEGQIQYFSTTGIHVVLVNPWNSIPEDLQVNLLPLDNEELVEVSCYQALLQMLSDCESAGNKPYVCSAYRTQAKQEYLYQRKVDYYLKRDYEQEEAEELAAQVVAIPGTSEHQLGLAADICDKDYPYLDEKQAETKTQQWLMEHCWEYGFILRYPTGSTEITGIIYEPWHYRYVGVEIATELQELGITLEEYLGFTHE